MGKNTKNSNVAQLEPNLTQETQPSEEFIGTIFKSAMTVLRVIQLRLIPVVKAATPDQAPSKPPPMKYDDLSMYECPHRVYKNFVEEEDNCPGHDVKIVHEMLLPTVAEYRKNISDSFNDFKTGLVDLYKDLSHDYKETERDFLVYMRDPENLGVRLLFIGTSVVAGARLGRTIPRKVFGAGVGLFVSGSICFPEETDEAARTLMYKLGKALVPLYNLYFRTDWELRERVPCARDMPEIPPPTKPYPACSPGTAEGKK